MAMLKVGLAAQAALNKLKDLDFIPTAALVLLKEKEWEVEINLLGARS